MVTGVAPSDDSLPDVCLRDDRATHSRVLLPLDDKLAYRSASLGCTKLLLALRDPISHRTQQHIACGCALTLRLRQARVTRQSCGHKHAVYWVEPVVRYIVPRASDSRYELWAVVRRRCTHHDNIDLADSIYDP